MQGVRKKVQDLNLNASGDLWVFSLMSFVLLKWLAYQEVRF